MECRILKKICSQNYNKRGRHCLRPVQDVKLNKVLIQDKSASHGKQNYGESINWRLEWQHQTGVSYTDIVKKGSIPPYRNFK